MSLSREDSLEQKTASPRAGRLSIALRALEVWLVISVIEVIHGVARVSLLQPLVGDFRARQIGVFTGSALILVTAFVFRRWMYLTSIRDGLIVGALWVGLTVLFELVLGKLVLHLSWERILSDYDLGNGGLMPIGLAIMLLSPVIASRVRRS